ncbi:hypothetical protein DLM45_06250 [Hyphomicrobium methylovorum]|nr:protein-disulfide reductase DsbD domain-containing protein [Hyphomicrobium methylovorum]MBA2125826.1 hypothetical protein [Hyphomicrobium methylovorum]
MVCLFLVCGSTAALCETATPLATDWVEGFNNKARLLAGHATPAGEQKGTFAGIEIAMPEGWKTYWRVPGDAGGVPPEFDWSGSENLASAEVLYPAPHRSTDKAGDSVGYKNRVLFPVRLTAKDETKPIVVKSRIDYGVCKDICIPAEAKLELEIPNALGNSPDLDEALAKVPVGKPRAGVDPALETWRLDKASGKPKLVLTVASASTKDVDVFVAAPGGAYLPLPQRTDAKDANGANVEFNVDLSDGVDLDALNGNPLTVTMVDSKGQSETTIKLDTK